MAKRGPKPKTSETIEGCLHIDGFARGDGVERVVIPEAITPPEPEPQAPKETSKDTTGSYFDATPIGANIKVTVKPGTNARYLEGLTEKGWQRIYEIGPRGCCVVLPAGKYDQLRLSS